MIRKTLISLFALVAATPASAEKLATVWTIRDVTSPLPTVAEPEKTFFEQQALPFRLVRLDNETDIGKSKPLAKGSLLYLVMDKTNRLAFCTFKDMSASNTAKSLFIPALDRRPCFIDDDKDGKFEKMFTVFELWGTVLPTPKGELIRSIPVAPISYSAADPSETPVDYRINYYVHLKAKTKMPNLRFVAKAKNESVVQDAGGARDGEGYVAEALNYAVRMKVGTGDQVGLTMTPNQNNTMVVLADHYEMMKPEEFPRARKGKK